jgi:hypothetical protein
MAGAKGGTRPQTKDVHLQFRFPGEDRAGERGNFFLGVWHPRLTIHVDWADEPSQRSVVSRKGPNWLLASAASPLHRAGTGLVHEADDQHDAAAFRGYIVPRLHSYSPSREVLGYWRDHALDEHNGVFAAAVIGEEGRTLTLVADALGMGPLYYRSLGDMTVFSTNARYLTIDGDRPDLTAWRCLLQTSWILGDRSLSLDVQRVPAGHALCLSESGTRLRAWFTVDRIPAGTAAVGPTAIGEVEEVFQQAVSRALKLDVGGTTLPLSSGFDSRRILAGLLKRSVEFQAMTCRVFQKGRRDLDARFASEMARDFGFAHAVVAPTSDEQYVSDDRIRRLLVDAETREHTWAVRIMQALPRRPSVFLDGIGGDILGDPVGWSAHAGLSVATRSPDEDLEEIASRTITGGFDSIFHPKRWPAAADLRVELKAYLRPYCPRDNLAELAFLLLRQRRTIAVWSQQLLPAGHVSVCPYLDLDYLRLLLGFSSSTKHATKFQRACLREFWPELYKYRGNRDVPEELEPESGDPDRERTRRCYAAMVEELEGRQGMTMLRDLLTPRARAMLGLSRWNATIRDRSLWYLQPLVELVSRQVRLASCWVVRSA